MNNIEPTHFESLYPPNTRENEIAKILSFIKEGSSCQVIGLPGGGRSNLLGLLSYNRNVRLKHLGENQKWFHFVLCNFAEIRNKPLIDATKFLFMSLIDSMYARHSGELPQPVIASEAKQSHDGIATGSSSPRNDTGINSGLARMTKKLIEIFKESIVGNDELVLFQGLKRAIDLLAIEKELTVVFLFDRFEDYVSTATPEFFTNLRVLRDRAKYRFSVVFSLHKPLEDLIGQDLLLDFYQFVAGHTVYLSLFDKIGLDFRIAYMEKVSGKTLGKEIIDAIIKVTSGHPNLTRLAVEAALDSPHPSPLPQRGEGISTFTPSPLRGEGGGEGGLEELLLEQKPIKAALFDIWKCLTPAEQSLLKRHSGEVDTSTDSRISMVQRDSGRALLRHGSGSLARMTGDENNLYLENVGLIKNGKITIPLFTQFVKQYGEQSSHISLDPNTLSDSLTSSEFKLLTYLMQNSGKIIEREEVINAVWADTKSTAGVTDQALDQLIFRLRKKIEDDPNKPIHLETIKGRGLRFIA